jgi:uncharacterized membrane protein YeaQ/YmgE (transglycosylase-associated protein family)
VRGTRPAQSYGSGRERGWGACGALGAGLLLTTAMGLDAVGSGDFSFEGLVEAAFGAIVLLVLVNLIRLVRIP